MGTAGGGQAGGQGTRPAVLRCAATHALPGKHRSSTETSGPAGGGQGAGRVLCLGRSASSRGRDGTGTPWNTVGHATEIRVETREAGAGRGWACGCFCGREARRRGLGLRLRLFCGSTPLLLSPRVFSATPLCHVTSACAAKRSVTDRIRTCAGKTQCLIAVSVK